MKYQPCVSVSLFLFTYWQIMPFGHITPVRMVVCRLMVSTKHNNISPCWSRICSIGESASCYQLVWLLKSNALCHDHIRYESDKLGFVFIQWYEIAPDQWKWDVLTINELTNGLFLLTRFDRVTALIELFPMQRSKPHQPCVYALQNDVWHFARKHLHSLQSSAIH